MYSFGIVEMGEGQPEFPRVIHLGLFSMLKGIVLSAFLCTCGIQIWPPSLCTKPADQLIRSMIYCQKITDVENHLK